MLYFVATPIGNLKEITYLAVETLHNVACIYAENPRHSLKLLNHYDIKKPVLEYQKFSEREKCAEIIAKLKQGQDIAVVSDAGTPLISDPGSVLVEELIAHNLPYTLISGPCAAINAVVLSGLSTSSFCMAGFLPERNRDRENFMARFASVQSTLVFYIAVHDVKKDLAFVHKYLGSRRASLVREISKKFESIIRFVLGETLDFVQKGEFVLVVEGAHETGAGEVVACDIPSKLQALIDAGIAKKEAVKIVAVELGLPKSEVYIQATKL